MPDWMIVCSFIIPHHYARIPTCKHTYYPLKIKQENENGLKKIRGRVGAKRLAGNKMKKKKIFFFLSLSFDVERQSMPHSAVVSHANLPLKENRF